MLLLKFVACPSLPVFSWPPDIRPSGTRPHSAKEVMTCFCIGLQNHLKVGLVPINDLGDFRIVRRRPGSTV